MKFSLPTLTPRIKSYILFLIVSIIWGIAGPVIKYTLGGFTPLTFLTYRFFIAALAAVFIFLLTGFHLPKDSKTFWLVILYSFLTSTVTLGLLFLGFEKTTALYGTLISASGPIMVAIAGVWFLQEKVTRREMVGIGIALAGTIVTVVGPILQNGDGETGLTGNLLIFASLIVGVATAVIGKILLRRELSPIFLTNLSFVVGFVTILPVALFSHPVPQILDTIYQTPISYHIGVLFMALLSGTVAYWLWHKAQKTIEIGEGGLFAYLYPVIGAPLAVFWLGEKITMPFIAGAFVIAIGVIIAEYKKTRYNRAS